MAYDYRPGAAKKNSNGTARPLLIGLMLGLVLGIAIAAGVAIYIARIPSPFNHAPEALKPTVPQARSNDAVPAPKPEPSATGEKKPYTFYDILEGNKTPKPDQAGTTPKQDTAGKETNDKTVFYLQAGSYQTEADADNQKARIALLGLEARVKSATLADKGTVYRVRLGPYESQDEATQVKTTLKDNGVDAGLIKIVKSSPHAGVN